MNTCIDKNSWNEIFTKLQALKKEGSRESRYMYIGEIDDPSEAYEYFASKSDVERINYKTNWFITSSGSYITCSDIGAETLFNSGKVVSGETFEFMEFIKSVYDDLNKQDRIHFRVAYQGISDRIAKEIVCYELGIPAYGFIYTYMVTEIQINSATGQKLNNTINISVEADSVAESKVILKERIRSPGDTVQTGVLYSDRDNEIMARTGKISRDLGTHYKVTVQDVAVQLINTVKNRQ